MSRIVMLVVFLLAVAGRVHGQEVSVEAKEVAIQVLRNQSWVDASLVCPATVMPKPEILQGVTNNKCHAGKRALCLQKCAAGNASACYWLANELNDDQGGHQAAEALFQRSCTLGIMSGCTNRAAGMLALGTKDAATEKCAAQTFSTACASDDPWGCTMYGSLLIEGKGVAKNEELALEVLAKSCKYGPGDPACTGANDLRASILKGRRGRDATPR